MRVERGRSSARFINLGDSEAARKAPSHARIGYDQQQWEQGRYSRFKRIAMRADKTDQSFNAIIHLAAVINSK
jgi:hypothetical protein